MSSIAEFSQFATSGSSQWTLDAQIKGLLVHPAVLGAPMEKRVECYLSVMRHLECLVGEMACSPLPTGNGRDDDLRASPTPQYLESKRPDSSTDTLILDSTEETSVPTNVVPVGQIDDSDDVESAITEESWVPSEFDVEDSDVRERFSGKTEESSPPSEDVLPPQRDSDDDVGRYLAVEGNAIDVEGRYKVIKFLGQGTFGVVVEAYDRHTQKAVAVKISKNTPDGVSDGQCEAEMMAMISRADVAAKFALTRVTETFVSAQGHVCIVMPKHGPSLWDVVADGWTLGTSQLAQVAHQLSEALDFLHTQTGCVHTDLKPDNILLDEVAALRDAMTCAVLKIRICDLGGAVVEGGSFLATTRPFRAPEIILGLPWSFPADVWSLGCVLFELATGRSLFRADDDVDQLSKMVNTLGPLPPAWGTLKNCPAVLSSVELLEEALGDKTLASLIRGCLAFDPACRMTAREVMAHPFVASHSQEILALTEDEEDDDIIFSAFSVGWVTYRCTYLGTVSVPVFG